MGPDDRSSDGVPRNLRDLRVYQEAHACAAAVANAVTGFPAEERFALANQLRRAATSIYANIAEGHARLSPREQLRFYEMSRSSLVETRAHIDQAGVRTLLTPATERDLQQRCVHVDRLLVGLIRATRPTESNE
jgi:four helix bundle protein